MAIGPVAPIGGLGNAAPVAKPVEAGGGDSFAGMLGNALGKLEAGQQQAGVASQELATGKASDVSSVVMEVERASLQLQLASQVRNKLVDAYQELMRMQV